ncbi:hypothetical protein AWB71_06201 [Caballeronia peredens]|nr:hypothetical protein AWB71_06201 [Caballeronia peredens]
MRVRVARAIPVSIIVEAWTSRSAGADLFRLVRATFLLSMPWPIPTIQSRLKPSPLSWVRWLIAFVMVMTAGAAVVLLLWPSGKPTNSAEFWIWLFGSPIVVYMGLLGARLWYYEQAKIKFEVWEEKRVSIEGDWARWACRCIRAVNACSFLPATHSIDEWLTEEAKLPVNLNRAVSMGWFFAKSPELWLQHLLSLIIERFAEELESHVQKLDVIIILDSDTVSELEDMGFDCKATFVGLLQKRSINLTGLSASLHDDIGVEMIDDWIDRPSFGPTLLIAGQRATDSSRYSEGGVAILFSAAASEVHSRTVMLIRRPMQTSTAILRDDFAEVIRVQGETGANVDIWHTGLDKEMQGEVLEVSSIDRHGRAVSGPQFMEHTIDSVLGMSGPLSVWIALGLALQAAPRRKQPQLVVASNGASSIALVLATSEIAD